MKCSGVYTALVTPFDSKGNVDREGFRFHIQRQKQAGISGIVVFGTTGEAATLLQQEKEQLLRAAKEEAHSLPLMVGCGTNSTRHTIENIGWAAGLGADSALVITPFYNKPTQEGLYEHYAAISKASPIPIFLYNNPSRTGVNMSNETVKRLAQFPQICGIKECSGNINQSGDLLASIKQERPDFSCICGDDMLILPMMALGADGVISGGANLIPKQMIALVEACAQGNLQKARRDHYALLPLFNALCFETPPIPLKAALQIAALPSGDPRLPLTPLNTNHLALLKEIWSNVTQTF